MSIINVKFDVYFKRELGTLFKSNEVDLDGLEANVNLDLDLVESMKVNYLINGNKLTDDIAIKDIEKRLILIPFKSEVRVADTKIKFEIQANMKNGDVKVSQTYVYDVEMGIGEGTQVGTGGSGDGHTHNNLSTLHKITEAKIKAWDAKSDFSGSYNDLTNKPTIPTVDVTKAYVDSEVSKKADKTHSHSEYATPSYVQEKIAEASLSGGDVDLSAYATKAELNTKADKSHTHNELHSHSNKTVLDGITSSKVNEWNNKSTFNGDYNSLTNKPVIPSTEGLATESYVQEKIAEASLSGGEVDLSDYYTKSEVDNKDQAIDDKITILNEKIENGEMGLTEQQVDERINIKLSTQYKANPLEPLDIRTYDGSNQPTHPSVKYFADGFGGHKYWMAYTPYPWNASKKENPCITYSDDGINWSEDGISNPIQPAPAGSGYNSDTHLVYANGLLECWWREVDDNNHEIIKRKKSENGINWQQEETLHITTTTNACSCISPTVIFEENIYKIWVVYNRECLKYYESQDGTNWRFVRDINVSTLDGVYKVWHFDIIKNKDKYEFVGCYQLNGAFDKNNFIYYAESTDNVTYSVPIKVLSNGEVGQFDDLELYRPCLCIDQNNNYRLYYGAQKNKAIWHIGLVTVRDIKALNNLLVGNHAVIERLEGLINKQQQEINNLYSILSNGGTGGLIPVEQLDLNLSLKTIRVGESLQLIETVSPSNATNKTVTWSSNNTHCTVSNTGVVTGVSAGESVITCTSNSNPDVATMCYITIMTNEVTADVINNKVDYEQRNTEGFHDATNGNFTADVSTNDRHSSVLIEVTPNSNIVFNGVSACFFDENNDYVSGVLYSQELPKTTTVPDGARYISFAFRSTDYRTVFLYEEPLKEALVPMNENLVVDKYINKQGYYDGESGQFVNSTQYSTIDMLNVTPGMVFTLKNGVTATFWNKNKKLCGVLSGRTEITIPEYCCYMAYSFVSSHQTKVEVIRTT